MLPLLVALCACVRELPRDSPFVPSSCEGPPPSWHTVHRVEEALREDTVWLANEGEAPRAVVLVLHGLNLRPSAMNAVAHVLTEHGTRVLRLTLPSAMRERWLASVQQGICVGAQEAQRLGVPLHVVAYSLGALVFVDLLQAQPTLAPRLARVVLLAPAVTPRWYVRLAPMLAWMVGPEYEVPSWSPVAYRRAAGTSVAAYQGVAAAASALWHRSGASINLPTLVMMHPDDEVVSYRALRDFIDAQRLDAWTLVPVTPSEQSAHRRYRHLIIDAHSVGEASWRDITSAMLRHLDLARAAP